MDYFDDLVAAFRRKSKDVYYEYLTDRALIAIQGKESTIAHRKGCTWIIAALYIYWFI